MLKLFRRKQLSLLKQALHHIREANEIVMSHKQNKAFIPSKDDLTLLPEIENAFQHGSSVASYVSRCLQQRSEGKPEGVAKWHDDEVFDYHYPK